jgi:flagellar biosynthesis protein FlhB
MNALNSLFVAIVVIMIMSFGTGLILGGPEKATKILTWELKQLTKFGRWVLKHFFQTMSDLFRYLAKACGPQKKKTP